MSKKEQIKQILDDLFNSSEVSTNLEADMDAAAEQITALFDEPQAQNLTDPGGTHPPTVPPKPPGSN